MLRTSIRSVRALNSRAGVAGVGARQWTAAPAVRQLGPASRRYFADEPPKPVEPVVVPANSVAAKVAAAAAAVPEPEITKETPPSPPAPKKPGFLRRLRNLVLRLALLGVIGFASGVWYSRINDDFHDLFTEYIPFAEQAVQYVEDREYRKRLTDSVTSAKPHDATVAIPAKSGASWRVADSGNAAGRRASASPTVATAPKAKAEPKKVVEAKNAAPAPAAEVVSKKEAEFVPPQVNEPSRIPPVPKIDLLKMKNAEDPIVQDLVHIVNDLITVINADNAQARYGSTITKAKEGVNNVLAKIEGVKTDAKKSAASEVASKVVEFEKAADQMVSRVEKVMVNQEIVWRQEFEQEMERIQAAYNEKIKLLQEREQKLAEERLNTQLMEQAVTLKRQFTKDVKAQIEGEREGRLAKLRDLSAAVSNLEKLADGWNSVVDTNLKTQQLHVAVEAVRASLENTQHSKPFVSELVALKEIAAEDPVVDAAVASINPSAYQRGIASPSELIDRFRRVATEVRKASLLPEDAGVASHASSVLLSKVMFKKSGLADGDDVESILTRAQTYLEEGDLDNAAREVNGLSGWAKTLSRDWLGEVRKVLEVQQALDVISTEARLQSLRLEQHPLLSRRQSSSQRHPVTTTIANTLPTAPVLDKSYDEAIRKLSALQSNNALATQFHMTASPADLNALSMPEMTMWLHRAGYSPADLAQLRCIHVAGTKGKGSTAAFASAILQANPERRGPIGRYTSPHLISVRERIAIDGRPIPRELFAKYFFELWDRFSAASEQAGDGVSDSQAASTKPMFFRYLTLMAFHVFLKEGVRDAVFECGIGGEYDATNILPAEAVSASVITHLGIDHTEYLGSTLDEITWHKAGIFKKNVPAFINEVTNASQLRVLQNRAEWAQTPLTVIPEKNLEAWSTLPGALLDGPVQKNNRMLGLAAASAHLGMPFDPARRPEEYPPWMVEALAQAYLRGRCEVITMPDGLQLYLDGAHTPDSIRETIRWFTSHLDSEDTPMLIFNQQMRDPVPLINTMMMEYAALTSYRLIFRRAFFSRNETEPYKFIERHLRPLAQQKQAQAAFQEVSPKTKTFVARSVLEAIKGIYWQSKVMSNRQRRPKVLVTGSLYLVGSVLRVLKGDLDNMD
ncbi:hypothetical protein TD95_002426 [Thielaviopsis punctulata]|uniref:MICOS complex subunit MIC60 n=1 Tax=Thielaviopsis punctulata TaxID=72032 RepID=A0A0F4ZCH4_9PEZI|nr:hypothetical protein TD95_002426 [Thielaviopsis punctulata]